VSFIFTQEITFFHFLDLSFHGINTHVNSDGYGCFSPIDITDRKACKGLIETVEADFGKINVLVNNAGMSMVGPKEVVVDRGKCLQENKGP
jgi:NAD(P)-dependent dehydrogenase (short-subunit alcohol dehydrogenase family)